MFPYVKTVSYVNKDICTIPLAKQSLKEYTVISGHSSVLLNCFLAQENLSPVTSNVSQIPNQ